MNNGFYDHSLVSWSSYSDLNEGGDPSELKSLLVLGGLTKYQAEDFVNRFKLVFGDSHASGLDAFFLADPSGSTAIAFRGTEFNLGSMEGLLPSLMDILNDGALALGLTSLLDFFQIGQVSSIDRFLLDAGLITESGDVVDQYKGAVTFTGHSLGGHLALLAAYKYPDLVKHVYTFNGAGIAPLDRLWYEHILPLVHDRRLDTSLITNVYADKGAELTSLQNGWFDRPGIRQTVFIEESASAAENHAIAKLVKSLAVYRVLQMLDPELQFAEGMREIYRILDAASAVPDATLANIHDQLLEWGRLEPVEGAASDIEILFRALEPWADTASIKALSGYGMSSLQAMAADEGVIGRAARYSLINAQAMALISSHIDSGNTEARFDHGVFSEALWADRASFYTSLMAINRHDDMLFSGISGTSGPVTYIDKSAGITIKSSGHSEEHAALQVAFNHQDGGQLIGSGGQDRLYGWNATDQLYGLDGNDWLEGAGGDDTLAGGSGHDVLSGGSGKDTLLFSWDHDAEGHDRITDSLWVQDDIRLNGDSLPGFISKQGVPGIHSTEDETWVLIKNDGGYLLADRANGFANSVWLPHASGADDYFALNEYEPVDLNTLLGPPKLSWQASYGERILSEGRINERDQDEAYFWGSQLNDFASGGQFDDELHGNTGRDWLQGADGMDLLFGGAGSDYLYGGEGGDFLFGQSFVEGLPPDQPADRDFLDGGTGDDWLLGGNGEDTLLGQEGRDYLYGNPGNDWLFGGDNADHLWGDSRFGVYHSWVRDDAIGGSGRYRYVRPLMIMLDEANTAQPWGNAAALSYNDVIDGGKGDDWLFGEIGNDLLYGGDDDDVLMGDRVNIDPQFDESDFLYGFTAFGSSALASSVGGIDPVAYASLPSNLHGNDILLGGSGNDDLYGNGGNDVLYGGSGRDYLHGDDLVLDAQSIGGDDRLFGDAGNDHLLGGFGKDWLEGGVDHDVLRGGYDNDTLFGGAGYDQLYGDEGADVLYGGADNDQLYGGEGHDFLSGDTGHDRLQGEAGNDWLSGGEGNDRLEGADGDDTLEGGAGNDVLQGGEGQDSYRFFAGDGYDVLIDEDGDTRIYFEGGITRDDLIYQLSNDAVYLRYSLSPDDVIEIQSLEAAASYVLSFWATDIQAYQSLTLTDLQQNHPVGGLTAAGSGTPYNDTIDLSNAVLPTDTWHGGNGDDMFISGMTEGDFYGDWGDDTLIGASLAVTLYGGTGNDTLVAGSDSNNLQGGLGDDFYDIGLSRPEVIENADAGHDTIRALANQDEKFRLPDHVEVLDVLAPDHAITVGSSDGQQEYRIEATEVYVEMLPGAGVDAIKTDADLTLLFPESASMDEVLFSVNNNVLSVDYGSDTSLLIESLSVDVFPLDRFEILVNGQKLNWSPVAPIQYWKGSSSNDYWRSLDMDWLYDVPPMVVISDSGGDFDVLISNIIDEPRALDIYAVLRSGDDLVLRLENAMSSHEVDWNSDVQWRIQGWFVSPDHRFEYINGMASAEWGFSDQPETWLLDPVDVNHAPFAKDVAYYAAQGSPGRFPLAALIGSVNDEDFDSVSVTDVWSYAAGVDMSYSWSGWLTVDVPPGKHQAFYRATDGALYDSAAIDIRVEDDSYAWQLQGSGGSNVFEGGVADDMFWGAAGRDWLWGGDGNDRLVGGGDNDYLEGGDGDDKLRASSGDDRLFGGKGNDYLRGDAGSDYMNGGAGDDVYIYSLGDGHDEIESFVFGGDGTFDDKDILVINGLESLDALWMYDKWGDLIISFIESPDDSIRIHNWFGSPEESGYLPDQLLQIRANTADGSYMLSNHEMMAGRDNDSFDRLFYAMNAYEQPGSLVLVPDAVRQATAAHWLAA